MQALINTVDTISASRGLCIQRRQAGRHICGWLDEFQWSLEPSEYFHIEDAFMKEQEA